MGETLHLLTILLTSFRVVQAIPWPAPTQTTQSDSLAYLAWNPEPTEAPVVDLFERDKRDITVSPNTCGWINGVSSGK
jgi:hypothetical protein